MTVFEMITDIASGNIPDETERDQMFDTEISVANLEAMTGHITGCYANEPFRLEDHTTGEIIGTWSSLIAFMRSCQDTDLLTETVHDVFYKCDNYANFEGTTWLV